MRRRFRAGELLGPSSSPSRDARSPPSRSTVPFAGRVELGEVDHGRRHPVSPPPSIARSAPATISAGTSAKRTGAGSPLRLALVWKIGAHRAREWALDQTDAEPLGSSRQASG